MLARRGKAVIDGRWDQNFDDRALGPTITFCVQESLVHVIEGWRDDDAGLVMLTCFGEAGKARQFGKCHIHPEGTAAYLEALNAALVFGAQVGVVEHLSVKKFGADIGNDPAGDHFLAAFKANASDLAAVDQYAVDRAFQTDFDAQIAANLGHDLRDRAHAADAVPPSAFLAIYLPENMVKQDIGAARCVWAGIIADNSIKTEGGLYSFAFEPTVKQRACRLGKQVKHVTLPLDRKACQLATLKGSVDQGFEAITDIGRRFHR